MMNEFVDYYKLFGISKDSSKHEIKKAYYKLLKKYHPDVYSGFGGQEITAKLNVAYDILTDDSKRRKYDMKYDEYYNNYKKCYSDVEKEYAKKLAIKKLIDEQIVQAKDLLEFKERLFDITNLNMSEREFNIMRDSYIDKMKLCLLDLKKLLLLNSQYKLKREEDIGYLIFKLETQLKAVPNNFSVIKQLIKIDRQLSDYQKFLDFRENVFLKVSLGNITEREYKREVFSWLSSVRNCIYDLNVSLIIDKKYNYGKYNDIRDLKYKLELDVLKVPVKLFDADTLVHMDDEILLYRSLCGFRERMVRKVYEDNLDVSGFENEALEWVNNVECGIVKLNALLKLDEKYKYGKNEKIEFLIKKLEAEKERVYLNFSDYEFSYRRVINGSVILKNIINKKCNDLDKDELKFLYDLFSDAVVSDCYRGVVNKIKSSRNIKEDMAFIFDCDKENVHYLSDNSNDRMVVCLGNLGVRDEKSLSRFNDLRAVLGNIYSSNNSANFLENLECVGGDMEFPELLCSDGFDNLKFIGGNAYFPVIHDAIHFSSLEYIGGRRADFGKLISSAGFSNLKYFGGIAFFPYLCDASYFSNLTQIADCAYFKALEKSDGLNSLKYAGSVFFPRLKDASGLNNLHVIFEDAEFNILVNTTGLSNLIYIGRFANFKFVKDASGLNNLKFIGEDALFNHLENPSGLENLGYIGGNAYFYNLQNLTKDNGFLFRIFNFLNLKGLVGLETIKGNAYFSSNIDIRELDSIEIDNDIELGNKVYRRKNI